MLFVRHANLGFGFQERSGFPKPRFQVRIILTGTGFLCLQNLGLSNLGFFSNLGFRFSKIAGSLGLGFHALVICVECM